MKNFKKYLTVILAIFLLSFVVFKTYSNTKKEDLPDHIIVKYVIDGDTFVGNDNIHYRLIGIDTPELAKAYKSPQPFALEAKEFVFKLIYGKRVFLAFDNQIYDKYNRRLAYVYVTKQQMLNEMLLKEGLAKVYRKQDFAFKKRFYEIQDQAQKYKVGLWKDK